MNIYLLVLIFLFHLFSMVRRSRNSMLLTSNGRESFSGWVYEVVAAFLDKFSSWLTQMEERCFQEFKRRCFFADACEWQAHIQYFLVYLWILIKEGRLIAWRGVWGNVISFYNINSRQIDGKNCRSEQKVASFTAYTSYQFFSRALSWLWARNKVSREHKTSLYRSAEARQ